MHSFVHEHVLTKVGEETNDMGASDLESIQKNDGTTAGERFGECIVQSEEFDLIRIVSFLFGTDDCRQIGGHNRSKRHINESLALCFDGTTTLYREIHESTCLYAVWFAGKTEEKFD
ncbi:hypothetical protein GCK72_004257 [Caenorhabditis remanei]|uniref:Uncharacterized protein n=1 Tax=Caenorhabditis remanei TaxID=31234 RepID=A0A6A5H916_CAERE|nr:hypothetical protein GCK72_004257 [Caenorhabditis remanei]KAF1764310.1 hypothetical protein GCK72_004257 [Caenorhabditis remanei]